jgi:hypothetical protein
LHSRTGLRKLPIEIVLALGMCLAAACSLTSLRLLPPPGPTPPAVLTLSRCDDVRDVLCLVTFGLEPPDRMLIVLLSTPGMPEELDAVVRHAAEELRFPCEATAASPAVYYCTGPQLPLGSTIQIEVHATSAGTLLASGEFVIAAFALPTVPTGGIELPTPSSTMTPRPTRTPLPGPGYPNPRR